MYKSDSKSSLLQGINLSLLNIENGASEYNPTVPAPYADYSTKTARCWQGPCLDLCCNADSSGACTDNLVSDGGHYNPGVYQLLRGSIVAKSEEEALPSMTVNREIQQEDDIARLACESSQAVS